MGVYVLSKDMRGITVARAQLGSGESTPQSVRSFFSFAFKSKIPAKENLLLPSFINFPFDDRRLPQSLKKWRASATATKQDLPLTIPQLERKTVVNAEDNADSAPVIGTDMKGEISKKRIRRKRSMELVNGSRRQKRLSLDTRRALNLQKIENKKKGGKAQLGRKKRENNENAIDIDFWDKEIDKLIKEYSMPWFRRSLDWNDVPKSEVLEPSEHDWLTRLMQPMKFYEEQRKKLKGIMGREPNDMEVAKALRLPLRTVRRHIDAGQAARNKLIQKNLKLVLWEVYRQNFSNKKLGDVTLEFSDLCNAGLQGLLVALDRFQPGRKIRFSTYAFFWIRHYVSQAIAHDSVFSLPSNIAELRLKMRRERLKFRSLYGRDPTKEELRNIMQLDPEKFKQVWKGNLRPTTVDLENIADENEGPLSWWIGNGSYPIKENDPMDPRLEVKHFVDDLLASLTPREGRIIKERYGFNGKEEKSLRETAKVLGISNEMVRKEENKAFSKLRDPSKIDFLKQATTNLIRDLDMAEMEV